MRKRALPILIVFMLALALPALAADWPQWRGPERSEISTETGLLKTWPKEGPPLLWTNTEAGVGYSGPAIVGDRLFTMGSRDRSEHVYRLDTRTGKELWSTEVGPLFEESRGDGPRCTPTVDGDLLYVLAARGTLACMETATGRLRWQTHLQKDLGGRLMSGWGYSESVLVDGDKLVCSPGGSKGTLAALDKKTGKVLWRSKDLTDPAAYSSIIVAEVGGIRQYVQMTGQGVAGVAAGDGRLLWRYRQELYRTAVIPTPVFHDNHVFVTAGYGAGCDLLKLTPDGQGGIMAEKVYANKNMVNQHGGVVLLGQHLYGFSDGKGWVCQDFESGKLVWEEKRGVGKGSLTYADGHLYCYSEDSGTLALVEASTAGWKEKSRFKIPRASTLRKPAGKFWTHPVVANGQLYLRDQDLLFCFDVRERTAYAK